MIRRLSAAVALAFVLAASSFAGPPETGGGAETEPTPTPTPEAQDSSLEISAPSIFWVWINGVPVPIFF